MLDMTSNYTLHALFNTLSIAHFKKNAANLFSICSVWSNIKSCSTHFKLLIDV